MLAERVRGVQKDTATLTDLTERIRSDNDTVRPLVAGGHQQRADEDAALGELRRLYG